MSNEQTDFGAAYQAGTEKHLGEARRVDENSAPYTVIPNGYQLQRLPFEQEAPLRIEEKPHFATVESFAQYVGLFKNEGTQLFAKRAAGEVYADFEYHQPDAPSWNKHRAVLPVKYSDEFDQWLRACQRRLNQEELATLLDERIDDIRDPKPGEVITAVQNFQLRRTANFKAAVDMNTGRTQFAFEEKDEAKGGGTVVVPHELLLGLPIYEGGQAWEVRVRVRYGIQDSESGKKLHFVLSILKLSAHLKQAFEAELKRAEEATGLKAMHVL